MNPNLEEISQKLSAYQTSTDALLVIDIKSIPIPSKNDLEVLNSRIHELNTNFKSLKQDIEELYSQQKVLLTNTKRLESLKLLNSNELILKNDLSEEITNLDLEIENLGIKNQDLINENLKFDKECSENDENIKNLRESIEYETNIVRKNLLNEKFELQLNEEQLQKIYSECLENEEMKKADAAKYELKTRENLSKLESLILERNKIIQMKQEDPQKRGVVKVSRASIKCGSEYCKVCGFPKNGKMKICKFCKNSVHFKCIEGFLCKICSQKEKILLGMTLN